MYGSLTNRIQEQSTKGQPIPEVGMGATEMLYSDRHAMTIVSVEHLKNGKIRIGVTNDTAKVVSGTTYDGSAVYEYTSNMDSPYIAYYEASDKDSGWYGVTYRETTKRFRKNGRRLAIGFRNEYRDPHF